MCAKLQTNILCLKFENLVHFWRFGPSVSKPRKCRLLGSECLCLSPPSPFPSPSCTSCPSSPFSPFSFSPSSSSFCFFLFSFSFFFLFFYMFGAHSTVPFGPIINVPPRQASLRHRLFYGTLQMTLSKVGFSGVSGIKILSLPGNQPETIMIIQDALLHQH